MDQHISQFNDLQISEIAKTNLYQACANLEAQYVKTDAIVPQMVYYHNELQSMLSVVADLNARYVELSTRLKQGPSTGTENFEIHTGGRGDDPLQAHDP